SVTTTIRVNRRARILCLLCARNLLCVLTPSRSVAARADGTTGAADGRMQRFDLYGPDQLDEARARFAALATPRRTTRGATACDRVLGCCEPKRDLDVARAGHEDIAGKQYDRVRQATGRMPQSSTQGAARLVPDR